MINVTGTTKGNEFLSSYKLTEDLEAEIASIHLEGQSRSSREMSVKLMQVRLSTLCKEKKLYWFHYEGLLHYLKRYYIYEE